MVAKDVENMKVGDYVELTFTAGGNPMIGVLERKEIVKYSTKEGQIGEYVEIIVSGTEFVDDPRDETPFRVRKITGPIYSYAM